MTKEKKYFANLEKLKEVTSELEFKSSYYDDTVKDLNLDFRGMSHKYFSLLKQGKKAFEISIYEKLARVFNKLYIEEHRKGKTEKKTIDASDLYVDKENANSKKLEKTIYLERLDDYFDFGAFGEQPKIIQNFARITQGSARLIDEFISSIDDQVKRQDEFKDTFYSEDEQLKKILDHGKMNSYIDRLKSIDVFVYVGNLFYNLLSYSKKRLHEKKTIYSITAVPCFLYFSVILFSNEKVDYFTFKDTPTYDYDTLDKLTKKFPIKFDYDSKGENIDKLDVFKFNKKHNKQILNKIAQEYSNLEFNEDFANLVPNIIDLPFSWIGNPKIESFRVKHKKDDDDIDEILAWSEGVDNENYEIGNYLTKNSIQEIKEFKNKVLIFKDERNKNESLREFFKRKKWRNEFKN